uniref:Uncharacterized protein n=1 Tax=Cryptomonas curvata TaxID=233186 RepID=A0A7S0QKZ7_9CRYP|mmetsp:Transcript_4779/g.10610  ORF Transcript_4779/g.10610 Transcript_4779/m.10610 type:complete len:117 (+) Transcript_4779:142-492(+)
MFSDEDFGDSSFFSPTSVLADFGKLEKAKKRMSGKAIMTRQAPPLLQCFDEYVLIALFREFDRGSGIVGLGNESKTTADVLHEIKFISRLNSTGGKDMYGMIIRSPRNKIYSKITG